MNKRKLLAIAQAILLSVAMFSATGCFVGYGGGGWGWHHHEWHEHR
ncbi:MAG TPA: hypothetical protein VMA09_00655 [Candidatus Binataceae bacterium]|nr:hypothetical protein [Candidatus Binataceae bacterium]